MTRNEAVARVICASGLVLAVGCGRLSPGLGHRRSSTPEAGTDSGGSGSGGAPQRGVGGTPSVGGRIAMGGAFSTGGLFEMGGAFSTGGLFEMGGAFSTGGRIETGGAFSTGGLLETGGALSTGGTIDTGGTPSTGGQFETGGAPTGGALGSGGNEADGSAGVGGSPVVDGSVSSDASRDSGVRDASAGDADAGSERDSGADLRPAAASSGHWQWQGAQRELLRPNGSICASRIAVAVGGRGACFEDADDELECTGSVYTRDFGSTFVKTGIRNVDQVLLSGGTGTAGNELCAHAGTTLWCFGANSSGLFGTSSTQPEPDPIPWGGRNDVVGFATGNWNDICVLDQQGSVDCAGFRYGAVPTPYQTSGHTSFWMNTSSQVFPDDPSILRADQSRTDCKITTRGLECTPGAIVFSAPGSVVMGGGVSIGMPIIIGRAACWLESRGDVYCGVKGVIIIPDMQIQVFPGRKALALATQYYSNQICAVFADGSVECVRVAMNTGVITPAASAPPGTAMIGCQ